MQLTDWELTSKGAFGKETWTCSETHDQDNYIMYVRGRHREGDSWEWCFSPPGEEWMNQTYDSGYAPSFDEAKARAEDSFKQWENGGRMPPLYDVEMRLQPMKSAPRDETYVLLYDPIGGSVPTVSRYIADPGAYMAARGLDPDTFWNPGWYTNNGILVQNPTHWHPLP